MNLILAVVWFLVGVGLLGWEFFTGKTALRLDLIGGISPAWLAFPMCLYNLARWYSEQAYRRDREAIVLAQSRRSHFLRRDREPGSDIDPTFDFTSDKPEPPSAAMPEGRASEAMPEGRPPRPNITDQPPSMN